MEFKFFAGNIMINGLGVAVYDDNGQAFLQVEEDNGHVVFSSQTMPWEYYNALPVNPYDGTVRLIAAAAACGYTIGEKGEVIE